MAKLAQLPRSENGQRLYDIDFAGSIETLSVPSENVVGEVTFTDLPALDNLREAFLQALESPIGCPPLSAQVKPNDRVAILVGDRFTDQILGVRDHLGTVLLDHLNALGVPDGNVSLVFALGLHPPGVMAENLDPELGSRIRLVVHAPDDPAELSYRGSTSRGTPVWINRTVAEADFVLGVGEISPQLHAGFCGGGKIILPGVSGRDTIEQNHQWIMLPEILMGLVEGNPVRADMEEAADLAGLSMKVDFLVNSGTRIVAVYAGDFRAEFRAALPQAKSIWMSYTEPSDITILHPGEMREKYLALSLYMTLEGGALMTKEDGVIIAVISGSEGWAPGGGTTANVFCTPDVLRKSVPEIARILVRKEPGLRDNGMIYSARRVLESRRVFLVTSAISEEDACDYGFSWSTNSLEAAVKKALGEKGSGATINTNFQRGYCWRAMPWR